MEITHAIKEHMGKKYLTLYDDDSKEYSVGGLAKCKMVLEYLEEIKKFINDSSIVNTEGCSVFLDSRKRWKEIKIRLVKMNGAYESRLELNKKKCSVFLKRLDVIKEYINDNPSKHDQTILPPFLFLPETDSTPLF